MKVRRCSCRREIYGSVAAVVVLAIILPLAGCSRSNPSDTETAARATVSAHGVDLTADIEGMKVTAHSGPDVANNGTPLTISPAESFTRADDPDGLTPVGRPFAVTLGNGQQPQEPIILAIDMSSYPRLYNQFSDTVVPIVRSNVDDPTRSDLFIPKWDAAAKTLTVRTSHLSKFQVAMLNIVDFTGQLVRTFTGLDHPEKPSCKHESGVDIAGETLQLQISSDKYIHACLGESNGRAQVAIASSSGQYYDVMEKGSGTFTNSGVPSTTDTFALGVADMFNTGDIKGLLTPNGTGEFTLPPRATEAKIALEVDPVYLQFDTLALATDLLVGLGGADTFKDLMNALSHADCGLSLLRDSTAFSPSDRQSWLTTWKDIATCSLSFAPEAASMSRKVAFSKVQAVASLITQGPGLVVDNLGGILGEFTGENRVEILVSAVEKAKQATSAPTTSASPGSDSYLLARPTTRENGSGGDQLKKGSLFQICSSCEEMDIYFTWDLKQPHTSYCTIETIVTGPGFHNEATIGGRYCSGDTSTSSLRSGITTPGTYQYRFTLTDQEVGKEYVKSGAFTVVKEK